VRNDDLARSGLLGEVLEDEIELTPEAVQPGSIDRTVAQLNSAGEDTAQALQAAAVGSSTSTRGRSFTTAFGRVPTCP